MIAPAKGPDGGLEVVGALTLIVLAFALVPVSMMVNAWALRALWVWFVVPTFHLAPLAYGPAMGLALIVGLFRQRSPDDPKDAERSVTVRVSRAIGATILAPVSVWCIGWLVQRVAS